MALAQRRRVTRRHTVLLLLSVALAACSASSGSSRNDTGGGGAGATGAGGDGGGFQPSGGGGGAPPIDEDPKTCAEAAAAKSYVGCDFWPTVTDNIVFSYFDYAVVVANAGDVPAEVNVERLGGSVATATVEPNTLETIYLPWVDELKGQSFMGFCAPSSLKLETVHAVGGAYHLTSSVPVTVYQFNAIEYAGVGGPPGKDWTECQQACGLIGCFSYTNDASLLLPSTALTGTYRIGGAPAWPDAETGFAYPPYFAVTGTTDGTQVTVHLSATGAIAGGGGVASTPAGGTATFSLDRGDVVQVVGTSTADFSGSLVSASAPVQVITGIGCTNNPHDSDACDHVEESVLPAETLGKRYYVSVPTSPLGTVIGHVVRIYGNVDGTALSYPGVNPGGPATIDAGEVVDLGIVSSDFEIVGDHELAVASFQLGADLVMPGVASDQQKGDPDQSFMVAVEQYRKKYVFLAPTDYDVSFVDVVAPDGAVLELDGAPVTATVTPISSGYGIARVQLGPGAGGAHVLTASEPVGIQVLGYGTYTSYQYPGGLNLGHIAPLPPR
jgi:hypothetical protein